MASHFTAREANHDFARAKRATLSGPVFITDRGKAAHVLLTIAEYRRITGQTASLAEALSNLEVAAIDFELPPRTVEPARAVDFD